MGEYFQHIVDRDATLAEANEIAPRLRDWLVAEGVILPDMTDCVLSADPGYPPGPAYARAVTAEWAYLKQTRTNGVAIVARRQVFWNTDCTFFVCRACDTRIDARSDESREFSQAFDEATWEWRTESGEGHLACPGCGHVEAVDTWVMEPPWGFGNLGLTFWNWPPLSDAFVAEVAQRLEHRVILVGGKL